MGKSCYIIGPIGKPDTEERKWADFVKDSIVAPVVTKLDYGPPQRSDKDQTESMIMTGIVQQMFEADLVIADLTNRNPNVFYELGIRNCARKPIVHLIKDDQSPPFDLASNRAIDVSRDYEIVIKAQREIKERIETIEKKSEQFYSHVEVYMLRKQLDILKEPEVKAKDEIARALSLLLTMTEFNSDMLQRLCSATVGKPKELPSYSDLMNLSGQVAKLLKLDNQTIAEAQRERSSLTTTAPLEFDT